jgi:hypothetical protein
MRRNLKGDGKLRPVFCKHSVNQFILQSVLVGRTLSPTEQAPPRHSLDARSSPPKRPTTCPCCRLRLPATLVAVAARSGSTAASRVRPRTLLHPTPRTRSSTPSTTTAGSDPTDTTSATTTTESLPDGRPTPHPNRRSSCGPPPAPASPGFELDSEAWADGTGSMRKGGSRAEWDGWLGRRGQSLGFS